MLIRRRESKDIVEAIEGEYRRKKLLGYDPIAIEASPEVEDELRKSGVIPKGKAFAGIWLDETREAKFVLQIKAFQTELPVIINKMYWGDVAFHIKVRRQPGFAGHNLRTLETKM